jgi:hypothetical protein
MPSASSFGRTAQAAEPVSRKRYNGAIRDAVTALWDHDDITTGWTECLPLVARDGSLVSKR